MREALQILRKTAPDLIVDGEMHADAALSEELRTAVIAETAIEGAANVFVMPNIDAAHISTNLLKMLGGGVSVGPILIGAALPANIVTESVSTRGLVNLTAVTAVQIQERA